MVDESMVSFDNGETLFILKRHIPINQFKEKNDVKIFMEYHNYDTVKQNGVYYLFLNEIDNIDFVEL